VIPLELHAHGWSLQAFPNLGGSIGLLQHEGRDIFRRAPANVSDVLETGCFPLVPYANRIGCGTFAFRGQTCRLPPNLGDHPHSLHGIGWHRPWRVMEQTSAALALVHRHPGESGWPWPYTAEQRIRLEPRVATIELLLCNTGHSSMPAGLGLHPYFPLDESTHLRFQSNRVWLTDATVLPTVPADPAHFGDWSEGQDAAGPTLIDNAYDGWPGLAELKCPGADLQLAAKGADILQVYRPPGGDFICLEPVTHLPDAINRGGMDVLEPGERLSIALSISLASG
jgi:aldose 1-epimerase